MCCHCCHSCVVTGNIYFVYTKRKYLYIFLSNSVFFFFFIVSLLVISASYVLCASCPLLESVLYLRACNCSVVVALQIVKKTVKEEKKDSDYGDRAQAHYDKMKRKKKAALKS